MHRPVAFHRSWPVSGRYPTLDVTARSGARSHEGSISSARPGTSAGVFALCGDVCVSIVLAACDVIAPLAALTDAIVRPMRTVRVCRGFASNGIDLWTALSGIWSSRIAREALRMLMAAGLGRAVLDRIVVSGNVAALNRGAVLAICHSPWGRVLAGWISRDGRIALLATNRWSTRATGAHEPASRRGMRRAIGRLQGGRCVAITIDHFSADGCKMMFLNRPVRVCDGAARIAALGCVPLVPVVVRKIGGRIDISIGIEIRVTPDTVEAATMASVAALDLAVAHDPSIWADVLEFVSAR